MIFVENMIVDYELVNVWLDMMLYIIKNIFVNFLIYVFCGVGYIGFCMYEFIVLGYDSY